MTGEMSHPTTFTSQGLLRELQASTEHSRTLDSGDVPKSKDCKDYRDSPDLLILNSAARRQGGKDPRHEIWKLSDRGPLHDTAVIPSYSQLFRPSGFDDESGLAVTAASNQVSSWTNKEAMPAPQICASQCRYQENRPGTQLVTFQISCGRLIKLLWLVWIRIVCIYIYTYLITYI